MLPDLRVVTIAVISTFLLTVGVGFYTSSRLLNEPRKSRSESLASLEDSPISRIALNWPEPVQQTPQLNLDFAVTLDGSRNPVRDITNETFETQAELQISDPRTAAIDTAPQNPAPSANETAAPKTAAPKTAVSETAVSETAVPEAATNEKATNEKATNETDANETDANETAANETAANETVANADEPAVNPPPALAEEPASIQAAREILSTPALEIEPSMAGLTLAMQGAEAIVVSSAPSAEGLAATALMVPVAEPDTSTETSVPDQSARPDKPDTTAEIPSKDQTDPESTGTIKVPDEAIPLPQVRPHRTVPTPKKAIIVTKRPRRPAKLKQKRGRPRLRRPAPAPAPALVFPFNLFALQPNQPNQFNPSGQFNQSNQFNQFNQFNQSNRTNQSTPTVQTR